jgi:hypothetical protein
MSQGYPQAALEVVLARKVVSEPQRCAAVVQRVAEHLFVVHRLGEVDGARRPGDRRFGPIREHVELRLVAVRECKLAADRQCLERLDGIARVAFRIGPPS